MPDPAPARRAAAPGLALAVLLLAVTAVTAYALLAPAPTAVADSGGQSAAAGERAPVILYMTSWCGWCRKTRALLREIDAPFEEVDIEKSEAGRREYERKSGGRGGIPLIDIDGTIVRGFDEPRIRRLVAELKRESDEA